MGLYKLMSRRHNNAPAYQQLNTVSGKQSCYIYKYDAETWLGGLKLGPSGGYLYNRDSSPAPPISGWQYGKNGKWASDSLLSVIAITDTLKLICPSITIDARWDSAEEGSTVQDVQFIPTATTNFSLLIQMVLTG